MWQFASCYSLEQNPYFTSAHLKIIEKSSFSSRPKADDTHTDVYVLKATKANPEIIIKLELLILDLVRWKDKIGHLEWDKLKFQKI